MFFAIFLCVVGEGVEKFDSRSKIPFDSTLRIRGFIREFLGVNTRKCILVYFFVFL